MSLDSIAAQGHYSRSSVVHAFNVRRHQLRRNINIADEVGLAAFYLGSRVPYVGMVGAALVVGPKLYGWWVRRGERRQFSGRHLNPEAGPSHWEEEISDDLAQAERSGAPWLHHRGMHGHATLGLGSQ